MLNLETKAGSSSDKTSENRTNASGLAIDTSQKRYILPTAQKYEGLKTIDVEVFDGGTSIRYWM